MEVLTLQRQQLTMHASCVLITWSSVTASARAEHQVSSLEDALFVSIINRLLYIIAPENSLLLRSVSSFRVIYIERLSLHTIQSTAWRRHNSLDAVP